MNGEFFKNSLHGQGAHFDTAKVFEGMDWQQTGDKSGDFPHSIWELLFHMNYWQDFMLDLLNGQTPKSQNPDEESWPPAPSPESEDEWDSAVAYFLKGLEEAEQESAKDLLEKVVDRREETRGGCLQTIVLHNTYHAGQVVFARKIKGFWPPGVGGES